MINNTKKQQDKKENPINIKWVECINCGFKGRIEDFLKNPEDTKCPKCGEDVQRFEL